MSEVDAALASGPVVLELGASWCNACQQEKSVLLSLSSQYPGVAFMDVDADVNKQMQNLFNVGSIPQIEVIVKKNPDGSYLYIAPNGASTTNMENSKNLMVTVMRASSHH